LTETLHLANFKTAAIYVLDFKGSRDTTLTL
jgi:hypothetical protein